MRLKAGRKMCTTPPQLCTRDDTVPYLPQPRAYLVVHTFASLKLASDFVVTKGEVAAATIVGEVDAWAVFNSPLLMPRDGAMKAEAGSLARHTMATQRASARLPELSMSFLSLYRIHWDVCVCQL